MLESCKMYPVHTLPTGFPVPSDPPLESYCPPASLGLILSSVSGLIHPVTTINHFASRSLHYISFKREYTNVVHIAHYQCPWCTPRCSRNHSRGVPEHQSIERLQNSRPLFLLAVRYLQRSFQRLCERTSTISPKSKPI